MFTQSLCRTFATCVECVFHDCFFLSRNAKMERMCVHKKGIIGVYEHIVGPNDFELCRAADIPRTTPLPIYIEKIVENQRAFARYQPFSSFTMVMIIVAIGLGFAFWMWRRWRRRREGGNDKNMQVQKSRSPVGDRSYSPPADRRLPRTMTMREFLDANPSPSASREGTPVPDYRAASCPPVLTPQRPPNSVFRPPPVADDNDNDEQQEQQQQQQQNNNRNSDNNSENSFFVYNFQQADGNAHFQNQNHVELVVFRPIDNDLATGSGDLGSVVSLL